MLDSIRSFFSSSMRVHPEPEHADPDQLRLAACALLLELAYADDEFTDSERRHLEGVLHRQFGLDDERTHALLELAEAERKTAVDLYQFTKLIDQEYSLGQKLVLAEAMWGLVYSDGTLADRESYLLRKISNLLHLEPGYLSQARHRAEERLEGGEAEGPD